MRRSSWLIICSCRELRPAGQVSSTSGTAGLSLSYALTLRVNYLRNGLRRVLGHSALEMTGRYLPSLGAEDLQAVHSQLFRLGRA